MFHLKMSILRLFEFLWLLWRSILCSHHLSQPLDHPCIVYSERHSVSLEFCEPAMFLFGIVSLNLHLGSRLCHLDIVSNWIYLQHRLAKSREVLLFQRGREYILAKVI